MRTVRTLTTAAVVTASVLLASGCAAAPGADAGSQTHAAPGDTTYPGAEWRRASPASVGMDAAALEQVGALAASADSTCVAVVRDGRLVYEQYAARADEQTKALGYSVTKSVTATLVLQAVQQGDLELNDRASELIGAWRGTPSTRVTVDDLLAMTSGREWDARTDYVEMAANAKDKTAFAIGLRQDAPPGEQWVYNNSAVQTLDRVLERATGLDPAKQARARLFTPLGMQHSVLGHDAAGNTMTFAGLRSTCADLARFGWMLANDGEWRGHRIVGRGLLETATSPSSPLNPAYGRLFWLNEPGEILLPRAAGGQLDEPTEGPIAPGAPRDTFWALGHGMQIVAVIPSERIVAVRLGPDVAPGEQFSVARFTEGVVAAIDD